MSSISLNPTRTTREQRFENEQETAKANGLEPYTWLRQLLNELPAAKTVDDVDALMPWHIKNKIMTQS
jgi:hypothetical protein